jgi:hypothetical protein
MTGVVEAGFPTRFISKPTTPTAAVVNPESPPGVELFAGVAAAPGENGSASMEPSALNAMMFPLGCVQ